MGKLCARTGVLLVVSVGMLVCMIRVSEPKENALQTGVAEINRSFGIKIESAKEATYAEVEQARRVLGWTGLRPLQSVITCMYTDQVFPNLATRRMVVVAAIESLQVTLKGRPSDIWLGVRVVMDASTGGVLAALTIPSSSLAEWKDVGGGLRRQCSYGFSVEPLREDVNCSLGDLIEGAWLGGMPILEGKQLILRAAKINWEIPEHVGEKGEVVSGTAVAESGWILSCIGYPSPVSADALRCYHLVIPDGSCVWKVGFNTEIRPLAGY